MSNNKALPRDPLVNLLNMIKGYSVASGEGQYPVLPRDVTQIIALSPESIAANLSFLSESGFVTCSSGGYCKPTEDAVRYAREAPWDERNAIKYLKRIVDETWYAKASLSFLQRRSSGLGDTALIRVLLDASGATESNLSSISVLMDLMIYARILEPDSRGKTIILRGDGAIAQGDGALAVGKGGVIVVGNNTGIINTGETKVVLPEDRMGTKKVAGRNEIYRFLVDYFSLDEVQGLCFEMGVEYEDLPGNTKSAKARSLVEHVEHRESLEELKKLMRVARPNLRSQLL